MTKKNKINGRETRKFAEKLQIFARPEKPGFSAEFYRILQSEINAMYGASWTI